MSVRVLPIVLGLLLVAIATPGTRSSEPISPGPPTPLTVSVSPAVVESPVPDSPALIESVGREPHRSSSLHWVPRDEPRQASRPDTVIRLIPRHETDAVAEAAVLPDAEPLPVLDAPPAPPLRGNISSVEPLIPGDSSDDPISIPLTTGTGIVQAAPTLVVEIAGPPRTNVGATASFMIYVKNMGTVTADGVVVQATIPEYVDLVGAEPAASVTSDHMLMFEMGDLDAEAVRKINLKLVPRSVGEVRLHTSVGFSVAASSTVHVSKPKLSLKCEAPAVVALGDLVTFQLVVENGGDAWSEAVTVVPQVVTLGESDMPAVGQFEVGRLESGSSKEILLRAMANREGPMRVRFVATDESGAQATTETDVRVTPTALDMTLVVPDETRWGVEQDYEIRVSNSAHTPARNVRIAVALPAEFCLTVIDRAAEFSPDFRAMTWQVGEIAGAATEVLRFKAKVNSEGERTLRAVLQSDRLAKPQMAEVTIGVNDDVREQRTARNP